MIKPGWNLLRFTKATTGIRMLQAHKVDWYEFKAINLKYEEIKFIFAKPVGSRKGQIIKDLEHFRANKYWVDVNLFENAGTLMIKEIKESKQQEEFSPGMKRRGYK